MSAWQKSSQPISDLMYSEENRFDLFFYNPYIALMEVDIWRSLENLFGGTVTTLFLETDSHPIYLTESQKYWGGITYPLNQNDWNLSHKTYLDIWMNIAEINDNLELHIDLGTISEDINNNGLLDTEDSPIEGWGEGNNYLDEGEDVGLDGCEDIYEDGWGGCVLGELTYCESDNVNSYITNPDCTGATDIDPNRDNYYYEYENDYSRINGTEGNGSEGYRNFDSEDLDRDSNLDSYNSYYSLSFNLEETTYIEDSGGLDWYLYRIPISDFEISCGGPTFDYIKAIRIWISIDNINNSGNLIKIARMRFINPYGD